MLFLRVFDHKNVTFRFESFTFVEKLHLLRNLCYLFGKPLIDKDYGTKLKLNKLVLKII